MRQIILVGLLFFISRAAPAACEARRPDRAKPAPMTPQRICGWFENPTPANAWIIDRRGEWEIAIQSGHQASGDGPEFDSAHWIETNFHYGYGCACLAAVLDMPHGQVMSVLHAVSRPIAACRSDSSLRTREPVP